MLGSWSPLSSWSFSEAPATGAEWAHWKFPRATSEILTRIFLSEMSLREQLSFEGPAVGADAMEGASCSVNVLKPFRLDPSRTAGPESQVACEWRSGADHDLIRLSLEGERLDSWGNHHDGAFVVRGRIASELLQVVKRLDFRPEGGLDLSYVCDPQGHYCLETFTLPADPADENTYAPVLCSRATEYAREAFVSLPSENLSSEQRYAFLERPGEAGWIDRQIQKKLRRVKEESCRFSLGRLMRLNRFFSDRGICSRREADRWIEAGRVTLNGRPARLGDQCAADDVVLLDGRPLPSGEKNAVLIAYNKAPGVECTSDPTVENNIIEAVNLPERIFHIGRLDKMSEGLILLTNMGDIVNKILRRRHGHEKEYVVVLDQVILDAQIRKLSRGVELDDGFTAPCRVYRLGGKRIGMVLKEGRNRQIRRMAEALGFRVVRLKRIRVMNIELGKLPRGRWRAIEGEEYRTLMEKLESLGDSLALPQSSVKVEE